MVNNTSVRGLNLVLQTSNIACNIDTVSATHTCICSLHLGYPCLISWSAQTKMKYEITFQHYDEIKMRIRPEFGSQYMYTRKSLLALRSVRRQTSKIRHKTIKKYLKLSRHWITVMQLNHLSLAPHKRDIGKQCRPRSDAAERCLNLIQTFLQDVMMI